MSLKVKNVIILIRSNHIFYYIYIDNNYHYGYSITMISGFVNRVFKKFALKKKRRGKTANFGAL